MLLGAIADDFTGAGDLANTLAKGVQPEGGLRTMLYLDVPSSPSSENVEAGVIALKSRSIPAEDAVRQSLAALEWLKGQGCSQFLFKYCSTFDSTPEGNIGPVAENLARNLDQKGVVMCPAFPENGRTVYQGHLFVRDRLLSESGMERHPLTPMTDPNLKRWLSLQTEEEVGSITWETVRQGSAAISHALADAAANEQRLVVVDAVSDTDLIAIAEAVVDAKLITGGSGVALGLPRNFIRAGTASGGGSGHVSIEGPEIILVGSCSTATQEQVAFHSRKHPTFAIDVDCAMNGKLSADDLVAFAQSNAGRQPLIYSTANSGNVNTLQQKFGREEIAAALEALFAETAKKLVSSGTRRIVVGGGETSGAVVSALNLSSLRLGAEIAPGVPVLVSDDRGLGLALKSGNFGTTDFFEKALRMIAGHDLGAVH